MRKGLWRRLEEGHDKLLWEHPYVMLLLLVGLYVLVVKVV